MYTYNVHVHCRIRKSVCNTSKTEAIRMENERGCRGELLTVPKCRNINVSERS